jgi:hypothetical protein
LCLEKEQNYYANSVYFISLQFLKVVAALIPQYCGINYKIVLDYFIIYNWYNKIESINEKLLKGTKILRWVLIPKAIGI